MTPLERVQAFLSAIPCGHSATFGPLDAPVVEGSVTTMCAPDGERTLLFRADADSLRVMTDEGFVLPDHDRAIDWFSRDVSPGVRCWYEAP